MMTGMKMFSPMLVAIMLFSAGGGSYAQNVDCRTCHAPGKIAADFSAIYTNAGSHHRVDISYPPGSAANENFNQPNGQSADIMFFDLNGNGLPDSDEIQLFGANGAAKITCASCHKEHGTALLPANAHPDPNLRFQNTGSAMCSTCHSQ